MASLETLHKTYQVSNDNLKPNIKPTEYQTILENVTQYLYRLHPESKLKHSFQTYNKENVFLAIIISVKMGFPESLIHRRLLRGIFPTILSRRKTNRNITRK